MPACIQRQQMLRLSEIVWGRVFQFAAFRQATKKEAIRFLAAQASTFLPPFDIRESIREVQDRPEPVYRQLKPLLASKHLAYTKGSAPMRVENDLTERIYVAYWALRLDNVKKARREVAHALNRANVPRTSRDRSSEWTSYDIGARLKQFESSATESDRPKHRHFLVAKWRRLIQL